MTASKSHSLMKTTASLCLLTAFLVMSFPNARAQLTLQVVSKTIEKTFPYQSGYEVNIEGEKAEIQVQTWDKDEVRVQVEIIARHPERRRAEKDLEAMVFSSDQHGRNLYFRNYIRAPEGQPQPESDLKALYTITLPADCPVYLKNHFGVTNVSNLTNALRVQGEFSKIWLENLRGTIGVNSRFGDIEGRFIDGDVTLNTRRSNITLHEIRGRWNITAHYGLIKLFTDPNENLVSLNIDAQKADVYFFDPRPNAYGYMLTAHYGNITVPNDLKFNFLENTQQVKKAIFSSRMMNGSISIKISFGDIIIRHP